MYRLPLLSTDEWLDNKLYLDEKSGMAWLLEVVLVGADSLREQVLTQVWKLYVKDELDVTNLVQTEAQFSYAMAVMYRIGGWIEGGGIHVGGRQDGSQIGGRLAACIWVSFKHSHILWTNVRGHKRPLLWKPSTWFVQVCWITMVGSLSSHWHCMRKNHGDLNDDIEAPCIVQWNDGVILDQSSQEQRTYESQSGVEVERCSNIFP